MKSLLTLLVCLTVFPVFGQFEVFPTYKLIDKDSISNIDQKQFIKSIKVVSDTINIEIESKSYAFVSRQLDNESKFSYPVFVAEFDSKFDIEIFSWEIIGTDSENVTFKLLYTRRYKGQGGQKGKYYIIDNFELNKSELIGFYVGELDQQQAKKVTIANIGLFAIVIAAMIIGTQ